ncbi:MAG: DUF488 domain-containing protein [Pirellulaceae bacterium]|nr:DUF488 domain-containing protein [Pirellulaceae bacterium]
MESQGVTLYSIGHSNHEFAKFVELLQMHNIEVLVDVRSQPWSRYTPHFNREPLQNELTRFGIRYLFMGDQLGGRPVGDEFYDEQGHVLYYEFAKSENFLAGVERLKKGGEQFRVAMMCSEEDPSVCHRFLLVSRVLAEHGLEIQHIRGDGRLESEQYVCEHSRDQRHQGLLFAEMEDETWKSLRSVLPKAVPSDFSEE